MKTKEATVPSGMEVSLGDIGLYVSASPGYGFLGGSPTKIGWLKQAQTPSGLPSIIGDTCFAVEARVRKIVIDSHPKYVVLSILLDCRNNT